MGVYMIDLAREICKPVLKLVFMAHGKIVPFFSVLIYDFQISWKKRHCEDIINLRPFGTGASKGPFS